MPDDPDDLIPSPWRIYRLVAGSILLATLNFSIVFVAFGEIEKTFSTDGATVSWALTGFSITLAALTVPGGWLADRFGRSVVFRSGFVVFLVGSAAASVSPTVELLIAARVIQAAGLALQTPAALAIVLEAFPARSRSMAIGAMGAAAGVAAAIGPVVGGALVDSVGWRWTFFLNVPVGLVVLGTIAGRLPDDSPRPGRGIPDLLGALSLMLGIGSLALAIVQVSSWGFADARTLSSVLFAAFLLVVLLRRSSHHAEPIIHLELFEVRDFRTGGMLSFLLAGNFAGSFLAFITFLTAGWHLSVFHSGLAIAVIPAIGGPMSIVSGRIADRIGHRMVILAGTVLMTASGAWLYFAVSEQTDILGLWMPAATTYAVGVGMAHAACQASSLAEVESSQLGVAGAMTRIFQEIGSTFSAAVVIALLAHAVDPLAGFRSTMVLLMAVSVLSAPLAWTLHGRGQPRSLVP